MQTMATRVHSEIEAVDKVSVAAIRKTLNMNFERQCLSCRGSALSCLETRESVAEAALVCGRSRQPIQAVVKFLFSTVYKRTA